MLILKNAFAPTWAILGVVSGLFALGADAIWGENKPIQAIAWGILGGILLVIVFRLLFAPYQIWVEDQKKIKTMEKSGSDSLRAEKKMLSAASADLLTSANAIYREWLVSDEKRRDDLLSDYRCKHNKVTGIANGFLHKRNIYSAAQDAMNRCNILIDDRMNGSMSNESSKEAHEFTRAILTLLSPEA